MSIFVGNMLLAEGKVINNDVLEFRKAIEFQSSSIVTCFIYIYLIIDGKRSFINLEST